MPSNTSNLSQLHLPFCWKGLHELIKLQQKHFWKTCRHKPTGQKVFSVKFRLVKWNQHVLNHLVLGWEKISYYFYFLLPFWKGQSIPSSTEQNSQKIIVEEHCHIKIIIQEFRKGSPREEKSQYNLVKHLDYFAGDIQALRPKQSRIKPPHLKSKLPHEAQFTC